MEELSFKKDWSLIIEGIFQKLQSTLKNQLKKMIRIVLKACIL